MSLVERVNIMTRTHVNASTADAVSTNESRSKRFVCLCVEYHSCEGDPLLSWSQFVLPYES